MSAVDGEQIREWKRQYGQIYSVESRGQEYVFRALTYQEFDAVRLGGPDSSAEAEEEVVKHVLLFPEELSDRAPAGVVTAIAERVMEMSGFGSPKRMSAVLAEKREAAAGDLRVLMKAYILATMPMYTEEYLDSLNFDQLATKLALAEQVLKVHQSSVGIEHELRLNIVDPEEEEERERIEAMKHATQKKPGTAGYDDPIARKLRQAVGG